MSDRSKVQTKVAADARVKREAENAVIQAEIKRKAGERQSRRTYKRRAKRGARGFARWARQIALPASPNTRGIMPGWRIGSLTRTGYTRGAEYESCFDVSVSYFGRLRGGMGLPLKYREVPLMLRQTIRKIEDEYDITYPGEKP